jgi:hypothetical protein
MRALFHPEFPRDVKKFEGDYAQISLGLAARFRNEMVEAIEAIKTAPTRAGHFLSVGSLSVREFRRRNLRAFPFFVLYSVVGEDILIGAVIPSRSDPLTWLARFEQE